MIRYTLAGLCGTLNSLQNKGYLLLIVLLDLPCKSDLYKSYVIDLNESACLFSSFRLNLSQLKNSLNKTKLTIVCHRIIYRLPHEFHNVMTSPMHRQPDCLGEFSRKIEIHTLVQSVFSSWYYFESAFTAGKVKNMPNHKMLAHDPSFFTRLVFVFANNFVSYCG